MLCKELLTACDSSVAQLCVSHVCDHILESTVSHRAASADKEVVSRVSGMA